MAFQINFKVIILLICIWMSIKYGHFASIDDEIHQNNEDNFYQNDEDNFYQNDDQTNQEDQTINQTEAKDLLKSYLLKKLDLNSTPTSSSITDTKVPGFLLNIFETNTLINKSRVLFPNNSNTIRSHLISKQRKRSKSRRNKSGFLVKFEFNFTLPKKEILNAGEFRLYLNRTNRCPTKKQRITINQILRRSLKQQDNHYTTVIEENELVYRQIDTLIVYYDKSKWVQFDVQPAVESWSKNCSTNLGFLIKSFCVDRNEITLNENKFIDNFIINEPDVDEIFKLEEWNQLKPILLTYSTHPLANNDKDSWKYNSDMLNKKKRHINQQQDTSTTISSILNDDWRTSKTKECTRHSMYVDFNEIGWSDWVVSPKGYDAYLCYGDCSMSFLRNNNGSNHATTQLLSNNLQPDIVPPPCCVPTEFAPLTMLYKDGNQLILKIYDQMVVKKCGCL